jgi:hypothetical protein
MPTPEQKKKLLKAKIAVALHDELGRVPKTEEIERVFLLTRVMYKAVLGLHFKRPEQKKANNWLSSKNSYADWLRPGLHPGPNPQSPTRCLAKGRLQQTLHRYCQWG